MQELLHVSVELVKLLDKTADATLPKQIVDVVKLHSKLAVGSAWIPVPGADVAAGAANIWSMYARINGKIGIPLKENVLKSIGAGVATNLTSYIAMSGVASAMKFIPGIGSVGGALIMSASLYAVTLVSGWVYLKALCLMVQRNGGEINASDFKQAIDQVLSDKGLIKRLIKVAKKEYKE
ncbi:MAG: hypothetical protein K2M56_00140 [Muribaculaceae bacterium]|nr:hypothetical protein [Muribaculaceae bacterium]